MELVTFAVRKREIFPQTQSQYWATEPEPIEQFEIRGFDCGGNEQYVTERDTESEAAMVANALISFAGSEV